MQATTAAATPALSHAQDELRDEASLSACETASRRLCCVQRSSRNDGMWRLSLRRWGGHYSSTPGAGVVWGGHFGGSAAEAGRQPPGSRGVPR
jgi:hypothetical protein